MHCIHKKISCFSPGVIRIESMFSTVTVFIYSSLIHWMSWWLINKRMSPVPDCFCFDDNDYTLLLCTWRSIVCIHVLTGILNSCLIVPQAYAKIWYNFFLNLKPCPLYSVIFNKPPIVCLVCQWIKMCGSITGADALKVKSLHCISCTLCKEKTLVNQVFPINNDILCWVQHLRVKMSIWIALFNIWSIIMLRFHNFFKHIHSHNYYLGK